MTATHGARGTRATHAVADVLARRARDGRRDDGLRVALAIEGGGMRGTISGGMALGLHELGLAAGFDAVYGSSAGAISGAWFLSSNPQGLRGWPVEEYARTLIRTANALRRRPVVDIEGLVEGLYRNGFPMDFASVLDADASRTEYHPLATDASDGTSTDLRPLIGDAAELRLALRASAALPVLSGKAVVLRGRRFYDAGLSESLPYRTALAQGATHVLVLRSRRDEAATPVADLPSRRARLGARLALPGESAELRAVFLGRGERLVQDDAFLAGHPEVMSVRPAPDSPDVSRLARDGRLLEDAFEAGRAAVHAAFAGMQTSGSDR